MNPVEIFQSVASLAGVLVVGAFAYWSWRLAVHRAAKETIVLLLDQVNAQDMKIRTLSDENVSLKATVAGLSQRVAALTEQVTQAAAVHELHEVVTRNHDDVVRRLETLAREYRG